METLKNKHTGEICWIIGKGPSLRYLKIKNIGEGPVIAFYEAVFKVRELKIDNVVYLMQKDVLGWGMPKDRKYEWIEPKPPEILLVHKAESAYECYPNYRPRIVWENTKMGIPDGYFSMLSAFELAQWFGCSKAVFISFDSIVTGNMKRYVPGQTENEDEMEEGTDYEYMRNEWEKYIQDHSFNYEFTIPL